MTDQQTSRRARSTASWPLAFRLARREVRRHPWRHALVVLMIAVPVLAAMVAFSALSTGTRFEAAKRTYQAYGSDLRIQPWAVDSPAGEWYGADEEDLDRIGSAAPAGSRVETAWTSADWLSTDRERPDGNGPVLVGTVTTGAPASDVFGERFRVDDGRAPEGEEDVFLTRRLAALGGWKVGDVVQSGRDDRSFTVTGIGVARDDVDLRVAVLGEVPDSYWLSQPTGHDTVVIDEGETRGSLSTGEAIGVFDVIEGWRETRSLQPERNVFVWLPPGADGDRLLASLRAADIYPETVGTSPTGQLVAPLMTIGFGALSAMVAIVASAAFAIASRRQLRTVGLLGTAGADPTTIRAALVLQGAIPGLAAGALALLLGLGSAWVLGSGGVLESLTGLAGAQVVVSFGGVAVAVVLGLLSGTMAAWWPARSASRIPVLSALAGRRPVGPVPTNVPLSGLGAVAVGAVGLALLVRRVATYDGASDLLASLTPILMLLTVLAMLFGLVALAPNLVAILGRVSTRATGTTRIALRGLARHRTQSAAAVAAVAICLAVPVAVLTTRAAADFEAEVRRDGTTTWAAGEDDEAMPTESIPEGSGGTPTATSILLHPESAIVVRGPDLTSPALERAVADLEELTGPVTRVPFVAFGDGAGGWQVVAAIDPNAADLLVPWAADQIRSGGAVALAGTPGTITVDNVDRTTVEAVGAPGAEGSRSLISPLADADYLVPASVFGELGVELHRGRPPINMVAVPQRGLSAEAARAVDQLQYGNSWSPDLQPTLAELREALTTAGAQPSGTGSTFEPGWRDHIWFEVDWSAIDPGGVQTQDLPPGAESSDVVFRRWLVAVALVAGLLSLLVLTITLLLRAVDSVDDHRAAIAAGAPPNRMRRQRSLEGMVLAGLGALLALPLGWLPVTAVRFGQELEPIPGGGALDAITSRLHVPGWELVPILLLPVVLVGVAWSAGSWLRAFAQRGPVDQVLPR